MDKNLLKQNITNAFDNFKAEIKKHTDINQKRNDGGWSIGEIGDHIIKSTNSHWGATKKTDRPYDKYEKEIKELFLNFEMKFPAATQLQPQMKNYTVAELFSSIDINLKDIIQVIDTDDLTEICTDTQLPVWGTLTKFEWLTLIENHIIRHTHQINKFI